LAASPKHHRRIQLGDPAHASFQRGVAAIVEAVRPTLGPLPRTVAVDRPANGMTPELLDSGAVIARRITQLADASADPGAMYLRGLLWRIHEEVGDGTATAAVIFDAAFREGRRAIASGISAQRLRQHLECAANVLSAALGAQAHPVADRAKLLALACSVTHDDALAGILAEIIDLTGPYGRIDLRDSQSLTHRYELVEGAYWERGALSDVFLAGGTRIDLVDSAVLLSDADISEPEPLLPALEQMLDADARGLLIVAKSISAPVTGWLHTNARAIGRPIVAVNVPGLSASEQCDHLDDLAIMSGARVIQTAAGDRIDALPRDALGRIRRGWATRTQFGLIGGSGDPAALRQHVDVLESRLEAASGDERAALLARRGAFHRGSVTLYIGGGDVEQKVARRSAERAIAVLRRARGAGVVPGGGAALLRCQGTINEAFLGDDLELRWTRRIVASALEAPLSAIAVNTGYEAPAIAARLRESEAGWTFDARLGAMVDAASAGILDPVDVVREVATRTIRAAGLALTIDGIVHTRATDITVEPDS
jgi:chaperonin GroEL